MAEKAKGSSQLTKKKITAIHEGLKNAGLSNFKIASLVLRPTDSIAPDATRCHSVQLPDGSWTIVCD
jgi:hypothetical protein